MSLIRTNYSPVVLCRAFTQAQKDQSAQRRKEQRVRRSARRGSK